MEIKINVWQRSAWKLVDRRKIIIRNITDRENAKCQYQNIQITTDYPGGTWLRYNSLDVINVIPKEHNELQTFYVKMGMEDK